jgi:hypothetical protein
MKLRIFGTDDSSIENIFYKKKYKLYFVRNVIQYEIENFNTWVVKNGEDNIFDGSYYFIIDTLYHDAFAHWVFESAIYLMLFLELKKEYPRLKLHFKEKKKYKESFAQYFGIDVNDITYNLEPNNLCIFPSPISCLNIRDSNHFFEQYVDDLFEHFNFSVDKEYDILLSPRGKLENFKNNDRIVDTNDIERTLERMKSTCIMYTDNLKDLNTQIEEIKKSKTIIITDGSPFMVNGMFAKNSVIIVLGNIFKEQMEIYKKNNYIYKKICENNNVIFLQSSSGNNTFCYSDVCRLLSNM